MMDIPKLSFVASEPCCGCDSYEQLVAGECELFGDSFVGVTKGLTDCRCLLGLRFKSYREDMLQEAYDRGRRWGLLGDGSVVCRAFLLMMPVPVCSMVISRVFDAGSMEQFHQMLQDRFEAGAGSVV